MFWIFKIIPDWFWWLPLIAGLSGYFLSQLKPLKPYTQVLKIVSPILVAVTIFIFGMLYANNTWKQAAQALQAKVEVAEAESRATNKVIEEKVVVKTQVVRQRGQDIIQYVDREVFKHDTQCVIPQEFVQAHNRAAEPPK